MTPGAPQPARDTPFEQLLRVHRLPAASDASEASTVASDHAAKLRTATEAHPLESMGAVSRLRALELQEQQALETRKSTWYDDDIGTIARKTFSSVAEASSELWNLKTSSVDEFARSIIKIAVKPDRAVYLVIFAILVLVLLRARGDGVNQVKKIKSADS